MPRSTFRQAALLAATSFAVLAFLWLIWPRPLLALFGLPESMAVDVVGRRMAASFAGLAVMLATARHAAPGLARHAIAKGLIVMCVALACLGVVEVMLHHAGAGILLAAAGEIVLALAFAPSLRERPG